MGILFLTTKQERCSDLLLWSAAWLLPPPMLRLIPTTATGTDMVLALVATTVDMVLATPDMVVMVLATTARGLLRPSLRLMPSTDGAYPYAAAYGYAAPALAAAPVATVAAAPAVTALNAVAAPAIAAHAVAAPALGYAGLGYAGLGYAGLGYGAYAYGKRSADAEPEADAYYAAYGAYPYAGLGYGYADSATATVLVLEPTELTSLLRLTLLNSRSSTQSLPSVLL